MEKARLELVSSISLLYLERASHELVNTRFIPAREPLSVVIRGLPSSASWQDLKDYMRKARDVCFAQVFRDGDGTMGIVDYTNHEDMKYAIRKLDDTEFKNPFARSYIRVKAYEGSPSKSRSRNRSRSPSKSHSVSRSLSKSCSPRSASPAKIYRSRSRSELPRENGSPSGGRGSG